MPPALAGLKVLDLSMNLPGPYLTWLLACLGAEVLKLENPVGGDYARGIGAGLGAAYFATLNRGKQSLALNLKHAKGRDICLKLLESHDILVEGFRPGTCERLGLGFAELSARFPRLIQVSITGYGQEGDYSQKAGHDINYLAQAGVLGMTGTREGHLALPGVQMADLAGGSWPALAGLLAAVIQRGNTGRGQLVDAAMYDGSLSMATMVFAGVAAGLSEDGPARMLLNGGAPCYGLYRTQDGGHMSLGALEPKFWQNFCQAIARPDLVERQFGGAEAIAEVAAIFAARDLAQWVDLLGPADCCAEPVLSLKEAAAAPLAQERGMLEQDQEGRAHLACPLKLSDSPALALAPAPGLGQHSREVLAGLGYAPREADELRTLGVVAW
ncbi:MAG: CoA transferase [Desulfarculus sp.]|nr:CoA transferase [Desulfarculus sp.]